VTQERARLIGKIAAHVMRAYLFTIRLEITDRAGVLNQPPERPLLWTFWHNKLFVMAYMYQRKFRGRLGAALASASKDGEIISAIIEEFGIRAIRGSSSRGGARALVEMKRAIEDGYIMAITPDGPRGPRYTINPGIVKLAQITGGYILPIHVSYSRFWRLKSWDGFMIPWPFARIAITFDHLHLVPPTATEEEFEVERLRFERLLRPQHGE
jgi:lysophospholipid acyltransferase (LPLAT)-like uncharacterized protein